MSAINLAQEIFTVIRRRGGRHAFASVPYGESAPPCPVGRDKSGGGRERMSSGTQWSGEGSVCRSGTQWSRHNERSGGQSERSGGHRLNVLDRLRWWLLHPGRI